MVQWRERLLHVCKVESSSPLTASFPQTDLQDVDRPNKALAPSPNDNRLVSS